MQRLDFFFECLECRADDCTMLVSVLSNVSAGSVTRLCLGSFSHSPCPCCGQKDWGVLVTPAQERPAIIGSIDEIRIRSEFKEELRSELLDTFREHFGKEMNE